MLSEGELRAERIRKAIKSLALAHDAPAQSLFEVSYLLVASSIHDPLVSDDRLSRTMADLLNDTPERDSLRIIQTLADVLSDVVDSNAKHVFPSQRTDWRLIVEVAHIVDQGVRELGQDGLRQILDTLFYELLVYFLPSNKAHHATVAHLALPLIRQFGSVVEVGPGPGELLITSGTDTYECADDEALRLLGERFSRLRLLREIRFLAHDLHDASRRIRASKPTLAVMDRTFLLRQAGDEAPPIRATRKFLFEDVQRLQSEFPRAALIILSNKERSKLQRMRNDTRRLVENQHLRAVIAFPSLTDAGKPTMCTALYFNRHSIPSHENEVAFIDVRQLQPTPRKEESQHCATLVGVLITSWYEGHPPSEEALEFTQAPRRVLAFVGEGLRQTTGASVPGFFRFAPLDEIRENDYSLRVENYVERRTDDAWRPKVQIAPITSLLSNGSSKVSIYLIGNNGAGKSLALADIAMSLAQESRHSVGVSFGPTDRFDMSPSVEPLKSFFTYSGARTSKAGTAHKIAMGKLGDMAKAIYRSQHRLACFKEALSTLGFEPRQYLVRMATRSTADPLDLLLAEVHELTWQGQPASDQPLENGEYKIAVVRRDSGEVVVFDSLSSGEQQVLTMVIKIVSDLPPGTTVLLDEPEISLHVAWQRQLPQVLRIFADALHCSFVVATHSPIVIASATDERNHCFTMKDGFLSEVTPAKRHSVEASLFEGFNIYTPHTHHIQERCAEIVSQVIANADNPGTDRVAKTVPDLDRHQQVRELVSLQQRLEEVRGEGYEQDMALIKSAIAAVKEVLTP
ncbi:AAA family ATPase [Rhodoferax saidenbachensis]|uniref:ABC-type enterochelin transport system ATPase subunit n=1 Tax=Rhodoferax saidenbachensis TaxID=1484693 RepID=A0ABU1ZRP9_9BURK|nr:AAA family ATPase [Rhodoferax saidenbachensis]MDR7308232.1 ABC-type enterochelin transport system ATPase subunit [Rhodoferax saidenbachensis]